MLNIKHKKNSKLLLRFLV